ncbi:ImmA/IrrE family metallo-endopeptidase [bacterium]
MLKVIKTKEEYSNTLQEIEHYIDLDPKPNTPEANHLELLTLLVNDYESRTYNIPLPDPIEAVKFRMEQQNMTQRDLIPFIGSRSKISEVLSKKRPLTLSVIRSLHENLKIPAEVLLQEQDISILEETEIDWKRFPIKEMVSRNWISNRIENINDQAEEIMRQFFKPVGQFREILALYRTTDNIRSARSMDQYSLTAWTARILSKYFKNPIKETFLQDTINLEFMRNVARLSWSDQGPLLAREYLNKNGIALIIEAHLPKTYLDGAALMSRDGKPIIGLTIRYDRIDNFWFSLMHELAHISLHFNNKLNQFYDDLEFDDQDSSIEKEADQLAAEALIPVNEWRKSKVSIAPSHEAAVNLAQKLSIHPAIVAGRIRYKFKKYHILKNLIGYREVRILFDDVDWGRN